MAKGTGIYISDGALLWVEADITNSGITLLRAGSEQIKEDGSCSMPDDIAGDIGVCFPPDSSYFYNLSFPFSSFRRIRSVLKNDIEGKSIDQIDSIVADFYPVSSSSGSATGIGITLPRERVEKAIKLPGPEKEPCLVTLDVFAASGLIIKYSIREGDYYLAVLTDTTALMGELKGNIFQNIRTIPKRISTQGEAQEGIRELTKRFEGPVHAEDIAVLPISSEMSHLLREEGDFPYRIIDADMERKDDSGLETADLLVPTSAAQAALSPKTYPNFRQEDLIYPGVFNGLIGHAILFFSILVLFFLAAAVFLRKMAGGYEQEITSLNTVIEEEAVSVIGEKELGKLSDKLTIKNKILKIWEQTVSDSRVADTEGLPESAFKILCIILNYIPEGLDISWKRIMIRENAVSLYGTFNDKAEQASAKYDIFTENLEKSEIFENPNKTISSGEIRRFRINLKIKEQQP